MRRLLPFFALAACSSSSTDTPPVDTGAEAETGPVCTYDGRVDPAPPVPKIHTPRWAFQPWISKDISDRDDTYAFVKGFRDRDIPVGVVVLDSPWETNYNTFVPSPKRYPEFGKMVADLKAQGIRTVLWVTQMTNEKSFDLEAGGDRYDGSAANFEEGQACGFFVNDGEKYSWWKGVGSGVDFSNDRARTWWHRQQHAVLDLGIAGWKLDFGENYIRTATIKTSKGEIPHQEYSEKYYEDFLSYGVSAKGAEEFVTMVRPYDESYEFKGRFFARKEHAPVAWVGDNRRDWVGLIDALDHTFRSAAAGYVVIGSDVGGYLDRDDKDLTKVVPADTVTFARWTATSALMPFMQLHGRANLTPWTVLDHVDETVKLYRYWSKLHQALVPFYYSLAEESYAKGTTILRPIGKDPTEWKDDYRYQLGDAFLVAPILDGTDQRDVKLPAGARWYDFWSTQSWDGGSTVAKSPMPRERIPVFLREGAIVPLDVVDDANALGTLASKGARTILVVPSAAGSAFVVHDEDGKTTALGQKDRSFTLSRTTAPVILRVRLDAAPTAVTDGSTPIAAVADRAALDTATSGQLYDATQKVLWIKIPSGTTSRTLSW
ncbi:MAG: glycoside hydrolase family 31 protein [Myxococcales bacterium]|nr:glycoside hydrolase family 31 protein [Myxococcales bacterium]